MRLLLATFFFFFLVSTAWAGAGGDAIKEILVIGKFSGGCGILHQQSLFQKTTDMENGYEFMARFWTTEAARIGMTLDEYLSQCQSVIDRYKEYENFAEAKD